MERVTIQVSQEMIDEADQRHRGDCAIAIAIRVANGRLGWASVDRDNIKISDRDDGVRRTWVTPRAARTFIDTFDLNRNAARPFTFTLDPDDAHIVKAMKTRPPVIKHRSPTGRVPANKGQDLVTRSLVGIQRESVDA